MGSRPGPGPPSRADLAARPHRLLNRGNRRNPDVFLVEHEGASVVVKDFAPRGALVRAWLGPWLLRRDLPWARTLAVGVLMVAAYLGVLLAMTRAPVAYVVAAREVSIPLAAILGWLALGESNSRSRLAGAAVIFAGLVLMGLGR